MGVGTGGEGVSVVVGAGGEGVVGVVGVRHAAGVASNNLVQHTTYSVAAAAAAGTK